MEEVATESAVAEQPNATEAEQDAIQDEVLGNQESQEEVEESEEIDVDGLKISLPKSKAEKLKAERLMQADYTRKTQEVAEQRKFIESKALEYQQRAQLQEAYLNEIASLTAVDRQLAEYDKVDWARLAEEEPVQAMKLDFQRRELINEKNQLAANITQKQQMQAMEQQHTIAKQVHNANEFLKREMKDWSDQKSVELLNYGTRQGIPSEILSQVTIQHPQLAQILNKAYLYDQIANKQPAAVAPIVKPVTKIGGTSGSVQKDPSKMSDDEFNAWRRSSIKRK